MYQKLVDLILKALEGQNLGNNKVVVETTSSGIVEVSDFEESEDPDEYIEALEEELRDKELEIEDLKERIEELEAEN